MSAKELETAIRGILAGSGRDLEITVREELAATEEAGFGRPRPE